MHRLISDNFLQDERLIVKIFNRLLDVEEGEGDGLPEVVSVFASHFEMLVEFFFDERVVLHRDRVPHQVFLP